MRRWDGLVDRYMAEYGARGLAADTVEGTRRELDRWGSIDYRSEADYLRDADHTFQPYTPTCIHNSLYGSTLDYWMNFFPKESLIILHFNELIHYPDKALTYLLKRLGVEYEPLGLVENNTVDSVGGGISTPAICELLDKEVIEEVSSIFFDDSSFFHQFL